MLRRLGQPITLRDAAREESEYGIVREEVFDLGFTGKANEHRFTVTLPADSPFSRGAVVRTISGEVWTLGDEQPAGTWLHRFELVRE